MRKTEILLERRVCIMKRGKVQFIYYKKRFVVVIVILLTVIVGYTAPGSKVTAQPTAKVSSQVTVKQPMEIPENVSCGKCGMYPAQYPRWQSQIIFKDVTMTPFDGCKCMFNFLFTMDKFDKAHSRDDVLVVWVKDFDSGTWINAVDAYYVVGSNEMGPMGKELIPFGDNAAAMKFQELQGGTIMEYAEITVDVLKTLGKGGMQMGQESKHMKM
jgi:nitrous oxide reductase accessory protein NosL